MASLPLSFCSIIMPSPKRLLSLQVRAQGHRDEGRSRSIVDANLQILRERIEEVRVRERCSRTEIGWNHAHDYDQYKDMKKSAEVSQTFGVFGLISGTLGLTIFSASLFLCIVSFMIRSN